MIRFVATLRRMYTYNRQEETEVGVEEETEAEENIRQ